LPPLLEAWESINCNFYWFFWKTQINCKISVKKDASFFQNLANLCLSLIWQHDCIAGVVGWEQADLVCDQVLYSTFRFSLSPSLDTSLCSVFSLRFSTSWLLLLERRNSRKSV
jgi:hypothetical protein